MSYLGAYLGFGGTGGGDGGGGDEDDGPDPIPVTPSLGASIPRLDVTAHALDRMCEYLRP